MTIAADPADFGAGHTVADGAEHATVERLPGLAIAAAASLGAGAIHAAAIGVHAEHTTLSRLFVAVAVAQLGAGLVALTRPGRLVAAGVLAVNVGALTGWIVTRLTGISWIGGLETREAPQFADTAAAVLAAAAIGGAAAALLIGLHLGRRPRLALPGLAVLALVVPAMVSAGSHSHADGAGHAHGDGATAVGHDDGQVDDGTHADDGHPHPEPTGDGAAPVAAPGTTEHGHDDEHTDDGHTDDAHADGTDHGHDDTADGVTVGLASWPRPWDPTDGIDVSGVEGVTAEQEARAVELIEGTLEYLPRWSDTSAAIADGYQSIGDAGTGTEHYMRGDLVNDDVILDPTAPESLVYTVVGEERILSGAMYIASPRPIDDPEITDFAGPLMQWHKHDNLCWGVGDDGKPRVVGIIDAEGNCANGVRAGGENPMVHVWITPHPCGVFAALEGIGAGTAEVPDDERRDMCNDHGHGDDHGGGHSAAVAPVPYDPTKPIDLGGVEGVSPEQQARAENLVAVTVVRLPQWSDPAVAEAAGFRSIGDGFTGHEHYIQWDWINDDVWLDPDAPESLVYEPQPDGSKKLVSAMFMLPRDVPLDEVPDIGGPLTQWHIHDDLCFTAGTDAPRVAGLTDSNGNCPPGLQKFDPAPMIHVWIAPHPCGPFAALEGVAAGQIAPGEERLCDHAHGSGGL